MRGGKLVLLMISLAAKLNAPFAPSSILAGKRGIVRLRSTSSQLSDEERIVYEQLTTECKVKESSSLLLCVSGGLDSMAMLHLMAAVNRKRMPSLTLAVVNFNHKLRPEADEEAAFVEQWAKKYNMTFFQRVMPENQFMDNQESSSFQNVARNWRRSESLAIMKMSLGGVSIGQGSGIVTAHHADDQVETTILKLLRGAHLSRLFPILPRSECGIYVRPLLTLSKDQLAAYMQIRDLSWREDSSNQKRKYKRNEVRLDVIPALERIAGGGDSLKQRLEALGKQSIQLHQWIKKEAQQFFASSNVEPRLELDQPLLPLSTRFSLPVNHAFALLPPMVQSEVIHLICDYLSGSSTDFAQTQKVLQLCFEDLSASGVKKKSVRISQYWEATKIGTMLRFEKLEEGSANKSGHLQQMQQLHNELSFGITMSHISDLHVVASDKKGKSDTGDSASFTVINGQTEFYLTLAVPQKAQITVRYPEPGDKFHPLWKDTSLKVTDLLRSKRVPVHQRDETPLVIVNDNIVAVLIGSAQPILSKKPLQVDDCVLSLLVRKN